MTESTVIKVTFNLYQSDLDYLGELMDMNPDAENKTQALRAAIAMDIFLRRQVANGARVVVASPDGRMSEVVFKIRESLAPM